VVIAGERAWRLRGAAFTFPQACSIAAITWSELRAGALRARGTKHAAGREAFLADLAMLIPIVPFDRRCAEIRAEVHEHLRARGEMIGERDLQIAVTALAGGHQLATLNVGEFARVPGLALVALPMPA
jgi:predicted nucleic acid-binding protein